MAKLPKKAIKEAIIVIAGFAIFWIGLQVALGTGNPFYVVASNSMIPSLEKNDILIIRGNILFEDIKIGDIIVFDRPKDHERVIVHRVISITDEDPRTLRTKGDNNVASLPGTDYPITENEYHGKVEYVIPQVGLITQVLKPPVNYIIIVVVIGAFVAKEFFKRKKDDS